MNKNIFVLSIAIAIIIFLRCIFDGNDNIIYIVAGINILHPHILTCAQVKIWGWSIAIGVIVILVYFWKWCSGLGNDIISILALGISILDDEIVKEITDNYKI